MQFHVPRLPRAEPVDELCAKMVHLTYAALYVGELTHDSLLTSGRRFGDTRGGLLEYTTGCEKHAPRARRSAQKRAFPRLIRCVWCASQGRTAGTAM
jgi:hypothetical protein